MRFDFKLPDLAEGMVEGEVVSWLVEPGQAVKEEQPVVEMMTDKATVVISSPRAGTVADLPYAIGDVVPVGDTLFVLTLEGEAEDFDGPEPEELAVPPKKAAQAQRKKEKKAAAGDNGAKPARAGSGNTAPAPILAPTPSASAAAARRSQPSVPRGAGRALATPATRRLARELGIDIGQVTGSGPAGRVSKQDVMAFADGPPAAASQPPAAQPIAGQPTTRGPAAPALQVRRPVGEESEERVRVRGLRRAIFETMTRSKATAAHFTFVDDVDCTNLVAARKRLKPAAEATGVRLSYLPFIAKAALLALNRWPKMNASMDDEAGEFVVKRHRHLGIAAATDAGLTVPTVRFADQLTLLELAASIQALGDKARANSLSLSEVGGSTFTITSLGKLGGLLATPIINHPEVAILGIHRMEARAVVRGSEIVARQMMNISLSFDHRVIDGHEGAAFAGDIKRYLEDPELMMLEMV